MCRATSKKIFEQANISSNKDREGYEEKKEEKIRTEQNDPLIWTA